jgi:hypothetical protein
MRKLPVRGFKSLKYVSSGSGAEASLAQKRRLLVKHRPEQILRCRRCLLRQEFVGRARSAQF